MSVAEQIIGLVNNHSPLVRKIAIEDISEEMYSVIVQDGTVVACVKVTKVSWYQVEITHCVVSPDFRRRGYGRKVLEKGLNQARQLRAKIAQCTIRSDNESSAGLFKSMGFQRTIPFIGLSGNEVMIWQKSL